MPSQDPNKYTFLGLLNSIDGIAHAPGPCTSLCYLVSLVDSPAHEISEVLPAKRILCWLYDCEEQARNAEHLKAGEEFFNRYFAGGFHPQTPCMVVKEWSPIGAMLQRGFEPRVLSRESKLRAVASGIWEPQMALEVTEIESARTDQALFWAIMGSVSRLALEHRIWINIIAAPGWSYAAAINSLPTWPPEEVAKAGRVLWKRTPEG